MLLRQHRLIGALALAAFVVGALLAAYEVGNPASEVLLTAPLIPACVLVGYGEGHVRAFVWAAIAFVAAVGLLEVLYWRLGLLTATDYEDAEAHPVVLVFLLPVIWVLVALGVVARFLERGRQQSDAPSNSETV